jgi:hypothetical protein
MKPMFALKRSRKESERGSVIAASTFGMLALLLAAGLSVDVSRFYLAKTELQNAADAAALAGARELNAFPQGITNAKNRAIAAMNKYDFNKTGVTIPAENVTFSINLESTRLTEAEAKLAAKDVRFIHVKTSPSPIGVTFASMILGGSRNLSAEASGGMSVPMSGPCDDWIPLAVLEVPGSPLVPGNLYTIRSDNQNNVSSGNYQVLAADGRGGRDAREAIADNMKQCMGIGQKWAVDTEPGMNSGPVRQGINTRFDEYASQLDPTTFPPDNNIKENITYEQYVQRTSTQAPRHPGLPNRRVVLLPIVTPAEFENGRDMVTIKRFAPFFLQTKVGNGNGGDIGAEYIGTPVTIGSGFYDTTAGPNPGPSITIPVLYK